MTAAVASLVVVGGFFAMSEPSPLHSAAIAQPAAETRQDAPAVATFKIVAADVLAPMTSAGPLTGDSSN